MIRFRSYDASDDGVITKMCQRCNRAMSFIFESLSSYLCASPPNLDDRNMYKHMYFMSLPRSQFRRLEEETRKMYTHVLRNCRHE